MMANVHTVRHTRGLFFGLTVCCPPLRLAKLAPLAGMTEWDSACIGGGAAGWAWVCTTDCVSSWVIRRCGGIW